MRLHLLATLGLLLLAAPVRSSEETQPPEKEEDFNKKLEAMLNLLCNIETKKYMMLQSDKIQKYVEQPDWIEFTKKIVGRAMKSCLQDLGDQQLFMKIATTDNEEERRKIKFPFLEKLSLEDLWNEPSRGPNEEEASLHSLFLNIDEGMKEMNKAEAAKKAASDQGGQTAQSAPEYGHADETEL